MLPPDTQLLGLPYMFNLIDSFGWHYAPPPSPSPTASPSPSPPPQTVSCDAPSSPPPTISDNPSSCSLSRLPEELLHQIFASIDPPMESYSSVSQYARTHNLSRVCLVSKQFRRIATPMLYMSIERGLQDADFARLLVTLTEEPGLNQYVKCIRQKPQARTSYDAAQADLPAGNNGLAYRATPVLSAATKLGMPYVQGLVTRWLHQEDILLTLCAFQAPNLEYLIVNPAAPKPGLPFESILLQGISRSALGCPFGTVHPFKHLRVLHLDFSAYTYFPASNALPLLLLPSLEDLTLGAWGKLPLGRDKEDAQHAPFGQDWTWPRRKSPIKKLSLLYPRVDPNTASKMILACKSLVRFETTNHNTPTGGRNGWYGLISSALLEHAGSLEELSIGERSSEMSEVRYHGRLWCARSLINLRYLRVPYHVLVGRGSIKDFCSLVPTSLRHLIVTLPKNLRCREIAPSGESSYGDRRFPHLYLIELHQKSVVQNRSHEGWSQNCIWFLDEFRMLFSVRDEKKDGVVSQPHIVLDLRHVRHYCTEDLTWCLICKVSECCAARVRYSEVRTKTTGSGSSTTLTMCPMQRSVGEIIDDETRGY